METKRKTTSSGHLISDVPHIVSEDGHYLYCKYWEPKETPKLLVCVLHGYGEHCARYSELAGHLNEIGAFVFSHDHVGHGESEGEGWYLDDYNVLLRDTLQHIDAVCANHPGIPVFLFGHSLGGNVAINIAHNRPGFFRGVVISAGAMLEHPNTATPFKLFLLKTVVRIFPRVTLGGLEASWLSRDKDEVQDSEDDPIQVKHGIRARTAQSCVELSRHTRSIFAEIEFPFLVIHGDGDKISNPDGARMMHANAKSKDKTLKIHPGMYHNLEHELREDREAHFKVITDWIAERA